MTCFSTIAAKKVLTYEKNLHSPGPVASDFDYLRELFLNPILAVDDRPFEKEPKLNLCDFSHYTAEIHRALKRKID